MRQQQQMNYLDIQLRDMDYLNKYSEDNIISRFLFPNPKPQNAEEYNIMSYEAPFYKALNEAKEILVQEKTKEISKKVIIEMFKPYFNRRYEREQIFLQEFKKIHKNDMFLEEDGSLTAGLWDNLKIPQINGFRGSSIPAESTLRKYASEFSNFIKTILGHHLQQDLPSLAIVKTLRDPSFCDITAGQLSRVFSTKAAERAETQGKIKNKKDGQDALNVYYEDLFNTFFFGGGIKQGKRQIVYSKDDFKNALKQDKDNKDDKGIGSKIFKQKFYEFIKKYYEDLITKNSNFQTILNNLDQKAIEGIYSNLERITTKSLILKEELQGKGISEENEKILKDMLKETLRQISRHNGDENFSSYQLDGLIELHEDWRTNNSGFYGQIQVKVNNAIETFRQVQDNKAIDKRFYNWSYWVDKEMDKSLSYGMGMKQPGRYYAPMTDDTPLAQFLIDFLLSEISSFNGGIIFEDKHRNMLRKAIFGTVNGGTSRGIHTLKLMSANSPTALRGLYGEIAAAYAIRASKEISTSIVGGEQSSSGTGQKHYDVVANIQIDKEIRKVGFQVKNYDISKSITLYDTSDGLGQKAMERYMPREDLRRYRWLVANGTFLEKARFFNSNTFKTDLQRTLYKYTESYLRITDASEGNFDEQINSDIFIVGDRYLPASFLIGMAYHSIYRDKNKQNNLFTLTGTFPKYQKKVKTKKRVDSQEEGKKYSYIDTTWTKNETGNKNITNLVLIDKQSNLLFKGIKVNFNGITANFKI